MLSLQTRFGNARADTFAEDFVFEGRKHREQHCDGAARLRRQIQRFGERHESHTQLRQFFKVTTRSTSDRPQRSSRQTSTTRSRAERAAARGFSRSSR